MGWIVWTVFFVILFWVGVASFVFGRQGMKHARIEGAAQAEPNSLPSFSFFRTAGAITMAVTAFVWVLVTAFVSFHTVGQREVAIVYNFSGTISGKKDAGVVTTYPWQHVKKENIGIQHDEWSFDTNNAAVSIDQQKITATISVNYQIDPEKVVDLYKRVGSAWKTIIIDARVPQVFKETTATYTTPELTQKREQLRIDTKKRLTAELAPYDIKVVDVFVRNIGFSQSYTDAIEAKQKQVQDALTAQAKVKQIEFEAQQKIAEARGEATSNRLKQQSLTPLLIQREAIDKLNPNVQVIVCPPQSVCIPNSGVIPQPSGSGG